MTDGFRTRTLGPSIARENEVQTDEALNLAAEAQLQRNIDSEASRASLAESLITARIESRMLTIAEATAGSLTLAATPAVPSNISICIPGGTSQIFGSDFTVEGNSVIWTGYSLETSLAAGDYLLIIY